MKVLVTGASGGLANIIIDNLLAKNLEVVATSRSGKITRQHPGFNFIQFDLDSSYGYNLHDFFGKPDLLIHLAWDKLKEHASPLHITTIYESNERFISNLVDNGLRDLVCAGTCYEYGLKEGMLKEEDEAVPVIAYGIGKDMLRRFVEKQAVIKKFNYKWLRIFNVFGEGKNGGNLYSQLMQAIESGQRTFNMSGGEQVRDYLTPEAVADIIVRLALQDKVFGIINCCSGRPVVLKEMIRDFLKANHFHIELNLGYYPYLKYEPMTQWGSTAKLNKALGYN
jgi:nucleoside-diphosphate-sugar epimerase